MVPLEERIRIRGGLVDCSVTGYRGSVEVEWRIFVICVKLLAKRKQTAARLYYLAAKWISARTPFSVFSMAHMA